jgi:hypothetical protein
MHPTEEGKAKGRGEIDGSRPFLRDGWLEQRCTSLALDLEACRRQIERRARLPWLYFVIGLAFGLLFADV